MKTTYVILSTALIALSATLGSCGKQKKAPSATGNDSTQTEAVAVRDSALYGKLGEGTGMSCIEIITDGGDTLTLNKTDENTGLSGKILGGTEHYNDRLTITTNASQESIITLVNLATLSRKWQTHPDSIRMNLGKNGKISGTWNGKNYNQWNMCNAKLVLKEQKDAVLATDTFEIEDLNGDSLILKGKNATYKFYSK